MPPEIPGAVEAPLPVDLVALKRRQSQDIFGMVGGMVVLAVACLVGMHPHLDTLGWEPGLHRQTGPGVPYGYTWSLAIYLVPVTAILAWYARNGSPPSGWKATGLTVAVVVPVWCLLDILLGNTFFSFPNSGATLGVFAPGWSFDRGWGFDIPIEEFAFYLFGSLVIVLAYRWNSHAWFAHHEASLATYRAVACDADRPRWRDVVVPILLGALFFLVGLLYKRFGPHDFREGFPGYLAFLILLVVTPTAIAFHVVRYVINVRSFMLTTLALVFTSLTWEVTLALPHGWWDFRDTQMCGLFVRPWSQIPIEEPLLWFAAAWSNVTLYEFWRLVIDGRQSIRALLVGAP